MNKKVWRIIGRFLLLMGFQLLVLQNVYFGPYVMPMLYVLFVLMLPVGMNRAGLLCAAFCTGLVVDVMNNMLGFHALTCTLVGMVRILFADRILTRGEQVEIEIPSIYSVTAQYYISFLLLMLSIFYVIFFALELFEFRGVVDSAIAALCSTVSTALLAILYQLVFIKKKEEQ